MSRVRLFLAERFNPCPEDLRPRTKRTRPTSLQVQSAQALGSLPADQNVQEVTAAPGHRKIIIQPSTAQRTLALLGAVLKTQEHFVGREGL